MPHRPMLPLLLGTFRVKNSQVSQVSVVSSMVSLPVFSGRTLTKSPSLLPLPRTSWKTKMYLASPIHLFRTRTPCVGEPAP